MLSERQRNSITNELTLIQNANPQDKENRIQVVNNDFLDLALQRLSGKGNLTMANFLNSFIHRRASEGLIIPYEIAAACITNLALLDFKIAVDTKDSNSRQAAQTALEILTDPEVTDENLSIPQQEQKLLREQKTLTLAAKVFYDSPHTQTTWLPSLLRDSNLFSALVETTVSSLATTEAEKNQIRKQAGIIYRRFLSDVLMPQPEEEES